MATPYIRRRLLAAREPNPPLSIGSTSSGHTSDIFGLANEAGGYRYDPEGLSPIPVWKHYFSKNLRKNEVVCGPVLRYVAGNRTYTEPAGKDSETQAGKGSETQVRHRRSMGWIDEDRLSVRALAGGAHLLKTGPSFGTKSPFGSGQCGSCPTAAVAVYHLSPETGIIAAFSAGLIMDSPQNSDGDIQFSPDWKIVTVYRAMRDERSQKDTWSFERYCLAGSKYEKCGAGPSEPPPKPRQIVFPVFPEED